MTYGDHQEQACLALNRLVLARDYDDQASDVVLECRRHVIAAVRERLTMLVGSWDAPRSRPPTLSAVANRPLQQLGAVLDSLARTATRDIAPSDLLPGPPAEAGGTPVDLWRCAARDLTVANHELSSAVARPWVGNDAALWHLAGDIATIVEAVVVLDERLASRGALPRVSATTGTGHRLIAGDVARLARWFGTDHSADLSYASPLSQLGLYGGPRIHMVHRPEDLARAQRTLAALLRARKGDDRPRAGLRAARVLSVGQIRLAQAFAAWAEHRGEGPTLGTGFRRRIPAYQALHKSTLRLVEVAPARSPLAVAQQTEMLMQVRAFGPRIPTLDVLADLNDACHEVSVSLGRSLRREGITRKSVLVLRDDGLGLPRPGPITNVREPFHVACKALADDPTCDTGPSGRWIATHREELRATLEREPSRVAPRARSMTTSPDPTACRPAPRPVGRTHER